MWSILDLSGSLLDRASDFKLLKLKGIFACIYIYLPYSHTAYQSKVGVHPVEAEMHVEEVYSGPALQARLVLKEPNTFS